MGRIIIILLTLSITGCNFQKEDKNKNPENSLIEKTTILIPEKKSGKTSQKDTLANQEAPKQEPIKYDYNYIKSQTVDLSTKLETQYREDRKGKHIPGKFLYNFLYSKNISIGFPGAIPIDEENTFVFKHSKEFKNYNLFTFTYSDETCCTTLYGVTTVKDSINVIDVGVLSYTGGDGGWSGEKYGKWLNDSIFKSETVSNYLEELGEEDNNYIETDTIWTTIKINQKGFFSEVKKDSVKYIGTKKQY